MLELRAIDLGALELSSFRLEQHLLDAQLGHGPGVRIRDGAQLGGDALAEDHKLILGGGVETQAELRFSLCLRAAELLRMPLLMVKMLLLLLLKLLLLFHQTERGIIND